MEHAREVSISGYLNLLETYSRYYPFDSHLSTTLSQSDPFQSYLSIQSRDIFEIFQHMRRSLSRAPRLRGPFYKGILSLIGTDFRLIYLTLEFLFPQVSEFRIREVENSGNCRCHLKRVRLRVHSDKFKGGALSR